jgi:hypothetical protein
MSSEGWRSPKASLHRQCPGPETIVAYGLDETNDRVRHNIDQHLMICPTCRVEVAALRSALEETFGPANGGNQKNSDER